MGLSAGKLRHRLRLVRPEAPAADIRDANGQAVSTPVVVAAIWAAINPLSARELFASQQAQVEASHKITIRYRGDLGARWWFEFDDPGDNNRTRKFSIEGTPVCPGEKREYLECLCFERGKVG